MEPAAPGSLNILIATAFWPALTGDDRGGFVFDQTQALVAAGHRVAVLVARPMRLHRLERGGGLCPLEGAALHAVRGLALPLTGLRPIRRAALALTLAGHARAMRRAIGALSSPRFDVIHLHDLLPNGASLAQWCGPRDPALRVLTVHGRNPLVLGADALPGMGARLAGLWPQIDRVVAVGRPLCPALIAAGVPEARLSVIANGARIPGPTAWNTDQRGGGKPRVLLSVGNLVALKGIDLMLEALAEIAARRPDLAWRYRVVGEGPERDALEARARDLALSDRVRFLGRLDHPAAMAEMAGCDIFALPSWGDAFGIVYLEAMGRGRPVIGCAGAGAGESVTDGVEGLLVPPRDPAALARALERLLADPALAARMGMAGRRRAEGLSWSANAAAYEALYRAARPGDRLGQTHG